MEYEETTMSERQEKGNVKNVEQAQKLLIILWIFLDNNKIINIILVLWVIEWQLKFIYF